MFQYYGSKSKIVHWYPPPKFDTIIEPFAGSARYSCRWYDRNIKLFDVDTNIEKVWNYLIKEAKIEDFKALKLFREGDNLPEWLRPGFKELIGFCMGRGWSRPGKTVTQWSSEGINELIDRIALSIGKFDHWSFQKMSYDQIPNEEATWFIDPPYKVGGHIYKHGNGLIDYKHLASWCRSRKGQVIVCENMNADWMEFRPLVKFRGIRKKTTEAIWTNDQKSLKQLARERLERKRNDSN